MSEPGPHNGSDWRAGHSGPSVMHVRNGLYRRPAWFSPDAQQSSVLPAHCRPITQRAFFWEALEVTFRRLGGQTLSHHICSAVAKSRYHDTGAFIVYLCYSVLTMIIQINYPSFAGNKSMLSEVSS